jgi:carbon-monoxide dehydrogenase medium subunit
MKAPAFDYARAASLTEALDLLRRHGPDAKIIAGGQSLVPALNLRLLAPSLLVDIGGVPELKGISLDAGSVRIGAMTRHAEIRQSPEIARHAPLLAEAIGHVAHAAIRNRGTIGGSLAHADPAAELPACMLALGATLIVAGPDGERSIAAGDFFRGLFETALQPDEILVRIDVPVIRPDERSAFREFARRSGDYAIIGLAAHARVGDDEITHLRLAYFGLGSKPTLAAAASQCFTGRPMTAATMSEAETALAIDLAPQSDLQASAETRLHLARVLLRRLVPELLPASTASERRMSA